MVFKNQIRYSPRRRASPCIAEGFSPTARGAYRLKCSLHQPHGKGRIPVYILNFHDALAPGRNVNTYYTGIFPWRRGGGATDLLRSASSAAITRARVSRGSMMSSKKPAAAA
jgi:hypothetical protein